LIGEVTEYAVRRFLAITKALADESRLRAICALRDGELCLCQLIELLQLAPSTVSKHMTILYDAGLIQRRKEGRWHYYRLAGDDATPPVRQALRWTLDNLRGEKIVACDATALCCVRQKDLKEVAACYGGN
jgi:DNA-binding transcriptional ArsR family regulator